ncbi:MAG TPA: SMC-Scp complex subunit ScpB [Deltaproteobacteria bacterium]|nr:SMC-Scp complex subunit ScpB [Deltaproteobacteria bacterium]
MVDEKKLTEVIETLLFVTPRALTIQQLKDLVGLEPSTKDLRQAVQKLNLEYELTGRVFKIEEVAGGFQMRTVSKVREWIRKVDAIKPFRLTPANLETLSIVAYKQPVTRAQIEFLRGVDSSSTLRTLLHRRLVRISGRAELPGKPTLYSTTKTFLEVFSLKSLKDLPTLAELDMDEDMKDQFSLPLIETEM